MSLFGSDHGKAEGSHLPCRYLTCLVLVLTNHTSNIMGLNQLFVASVRRWLAASGHVRNEGLEQTDRTVLALKNADTPWDFQSPFANLTFIPFRSPVSMKALGQVPISQALYTYLLPYWVWALISVFHSVLCYSAFIGFTDHTKITFFKKNQIHLI